MTEPLRFPQGTSTQLCSSTAVHYSGTRAARTGGAVHERLTSRMSQDIHNKSQRYVYFRVMRIGFCRWKHLAREIVLPRRSLVLCEGSPYGIWLWGMAARNLCPKEAARIGLQRTI